MRLLLLLTMYTCLVSCSRPEDITSELDAQISSGKTPSLQYSIFTVDSIIYEYQNGLSDIQHKKLAHNSTTYQAFSTVKTLTAIAILQLASKGIIDIHKSVNTYLPNIPYPSNITIKHLLAHSSGIPNPIPLSWIHTVAEHKAFDNEKFITQTLKENMEVSFAPNDEYAYSNIEYLLLGQLIEKTTGVSYEQYVEENIFNIIGTSRNELSFTIDTTRQAKGYHNKFSFTNALLGFFIDKNKFMGDAENKWKPFKHFYVNGYAYSGLIASLTGLRKYVQALLDPQSLILEERFKTQLFTENILNSNENSGMCLSWFKGKLNGTEYFTHAGGGGGYYCEIRLYPKLGIGSVIMFNRSGMTDERILDKFDQYFMGTAQRNNQ